MALDREKILREGTGGSGKLALRTGRLVAAIAVDAADDAGRTPLHYAFTEAVAQALIDAGANILARARDGRQPVTMTVAGNDAYGAVVVYPDQDRVRLRGAAVELGFLLRNVTAEAIVGLRVELASDALGLAAASPGLEVLHPAQLVPWRLPLARGTGLTKEEATARVRLLDATDRELAAFTLAVDARAGLTPEDEGYVKVTAVALQAEPGRFQTLAYLVAPILLLALWLGTRWRRSR